MLASWGSGSWLGYLEKECRHIDTYDERLFMDLWIWSLSIAKLTIHIFMKIFAANVPIEESGVTHLPSSIAYMICVYPDMCLSKYLALLSCVSYVLIIEV